MKIKFDNNVECTINPENYNDAEKNVSKNPGLLLKYGMVATGFVASGFGIGLGAAAILNTMIDYFPTKAAQIMIKVTFPFLGSSLAFQEMAEFGNISTEELKDISYDSARLAFDCVPTLLYNKIVGSTAIDYNE